MKASGRVQIPFSPHIRGNSSEVERRPYKAIVVGSIPTSRTSLCRYRIKVVQRSPKPLVAVRVRIAVPECEGRLITQRINSSLIRTLGCANLAEVCNLQCAFPGCLKEARKNPYKGTSPIYCSTACKSKAGVNALRKRRKIKYVEYKGGACNRCGYKKCMAALEFHHVDPSQKEFELTRAMTLSWDKAKIELDKCELVCANCHAEIHATEANQVEADR